MKILLARRSTLALMLGLLGYLVVIAGGFFFCLIPAGLPFLLIRSLGIELHDSAGFALAIPFWLLLARALGGEMVARSYRHVVLYQETLLIRRWGRQLQIPLRDLEEFRMNGEGFRAVGAGVVLRLRREELLPGAGEALTMLAHCCQADTLSRRLDAGETVSLTQSPRYLLGQEPAATVTLLLILGAVAVATGQVWLLPVAVAGAVWHIRRRSLYLTRTWGLALNESGLRALSSDTGFVPWSQVLSRHYDGVTLRIQLPEEELRLCHHSGALLGLSRLLQWRSETAQLSDGSRRNRKPQAESSSRSSR